MVGRTLKSGVAVAVVPLALRLIGENFVGLGGFLEPAFGLGVAGVAVRVILQGHLPIRLLDVIGPGILLQAEYLVIVALRGHRHGVSLRA